MNRNLLPRLFRFLRLSTYECGFCAKPFSPKSCGRGQPFSFFRDFFFFSFFFLVKSVLSTFQLSPLFLSECFLFILSRVRLSCDHGWIPGEPVEVRKSSYQSDPTDPTRRGGDSRPKKFSVQPRGPANCRPRLIPPCPPPLLEKGENAGRGQRWHEIV